MAVPCLKNHYGWTYFHEFMPTCLRGAVFWDTVYYNNYYYYYYYYYKRHLQSRGGENKSIVIAVLTLFADTMWHGGLLTLLTARSAVVSGDSPTLSAAATFDVTLTSRDTDRFSAWSTLTPLINTYLNDNRAMSHTVASSSRCRHGQDKTVWQ